MTERNASIDEHQMLVATFDLGDAAFGLDTTHVQEIVHVGDITPVHQAPPFVLGVMNLRGRITTVIDLGSKLELNPTEVRQESRIFIVDWQSEQVGLLVDRVAEAISLDHADLRKPPENVRGVQGKQFTGVFQTDGRLVALLDLAAILSVDD